MKHKFSSFIVLISSIGILSSCTEQLPATKGTSSSAADINSRIVSNGSPYIIRVNANDIKSRPLITATTTITPQFAHDGLEPSHVRGARIYDDFSIELGVASPGPNPLAAMASEGAITGDQWSCSGCHGFDYEGGILTFNNGATNNLLELRDVRGWTEEFVINMLENGFHMWDGSAAVNVHNYSKILTPQAMVDVADFVVNEIYDTHTYISASTSGATGDKVAGDELYNDPIPAPPAIPAMVRVDGTGFNCAMCHDAGHGPDKATMKMLAFNEPWKFLHRTNFGSPRDIATKTDFGYGDPDVMPGLYEVILTDGLHFGSPTEASEIMHYIEAQ